MGCETIPMLLLPPGGQFRMKQELLNVVNMSRRRLTCGKFKWRILKHSIFCIKWVKSCPKKFPVWLVLVLRYGYNDWNGDSFTRCRLRETVLALRPSTFYPIRQRWWVCHMALCGIRRNTIHAGLLRNKYWSGSGNRPIE